MEEDQGGTTYRMTERRLDRDFPALAGLRAYWEALRQGREVPARTEIDPRGIETALAHTFMLERIAPGNARFRLAGRHLVDVLGMEVRGMPLASFFLPNARDRLSALLEDVFRAPAIADLTMSADCGLGRPDATARLVLLPLRGDDGQIDRALGGFAVNGAIGRTPRRFDIAAVHRTPLSARRPMGLSHVAPVGFAEPAVRFDLPLRPRNRGHLRLVKSDG
ncbi:MAG: PAS domain-containing protein [Rhodobacteraceae bacterium]|nr:PAS domain-containing protein [Paracoccaceae bacterium]